MNSSFTVCDVLEENFAEKIVNDLKDDPINGLAFCVGSIDLNPLKLTKKSDFIKNPFFSMRYLFKKIYVGVSPSLKSINNLPAYTGPI